MRVLGEGVNFDSLAVKDGLFRFYVVTKRGALDALDLLIQKEPQPDAGEVDAPWRWWPPPKRDEPQVLSAAHRARADQFHARRRQERRSAAMTCMNPDFFTTDSTRYLSHAAHW